MGQGALNAEHAPCTNGTAAKHKTQPHEVPARRTVAGTCLLGSCWRCRASKLASTPSPSSWLKDLSTWLASPTRQDIRWVAAHCSTSVHPGLGFSALGSQPLLHPPAACFGSGTTFRAEWVVPCGQVPHLNLITSHVLDPQVGIRRVALWTLRTVLQGLKAPSVPSSALAVSR